MNSLGHIEKFEEFAFTTMYWLYCKICCMQLQAKWLNTMILLVCNVSIGRG